MHPAFNSNFLSTIYQHLLEYLEICRGAIRGLGAEASSLAAERLPQNTFNGFEVIFGFA